MKRALSSMAIGLTLSMAAMAGAPALFPDILDASPNPPPLTLSAFPVTINFAALDANPETLSLRRRSSAWTSMHSQGMWLISRNSSLEGRLPFCDERHPRNLTHGVTISGNYEVPGAGEIAAAEVWKFTTQENLKWPFTPLAPCIALVAIVRPLRWDTQLRGLAFR